MNSARFSSPIDEAGPVPHVHHAQDAHIVHVAARPPAAADLSADVIGGRARHDLRDMALLGLPIGPFQCRDVTDRVEPRIPLHFAGRLNGYKACLVERKIGALDHAVTVAGRDEHEQVGLDPGAILKGYGPVDELGDLLAGVRPDAQ